MSDLDKQKISVGAVCALLVVICGGVWYSGAEVTSIQDTLEKHSQELFDQGKVVEKISDKQDEVAARLAITSEEQLKVNDTVLLIKPSRWTYQMEQEYEREVEQHDDNPKYPWPDVEKIHDDLQPNTQ
jgi:hypothetical protein